MTQEMRGGLVCWGRGRSGEPTERPQQTRGWEPWGELQGLPNGEQKARARVLKSLLYFYGGPAHT